ncbi:uncharacterized protein [Miscanthus floridulus]|uniref:uncharacterized protein n=1 Tax=Miscanthus floridulus TaxID=154761 RepID=UPI003458BBF7
MNLMAGSTTQWMDPHLDDLKSPNSRNNLFYPTEAAAEEAAAAQDPSALFSGIRRHVALNEVPQIRVPAAAQSFLHRQVPSSAYDTGPICCVALSESETLFLDCNSRGAFLYDADERCVVTLPNLHESKRFPVCLSVTSAGNDSRDDTIYVMDRSAPPPPTGDTIQLQALVHHKVHNRIFYKDDWRCDELPPPPYVTNGDDDRRNFICSHALVGSASDVICVSTDGAGTYCFDTASRTWSKASDWALSFCGKIQHDVDLGIWVGFLHYSRKDEVQHLCVTADLFSATERRRVTTLMRRGCVATAAKTWNRRTSGTRTSIFLPKLVSLGSGKFCLVQFFETREEACIKCGQWQCEDVVNKFAVFTGVEVVRCGGGGGKDGNEQVGNGSADGDGAGDLRMIVHKSKRYMLAKSYEVTIECVL